MWIVPSGAIDRAMLILRMKGRRAQGTEVGPGYGIFRYIEMSLKWGHGRRDEWCESQLAQVVSRADLWKGWFQDLLPVPSCASDEAHTWLAAEDPIGGRIDYSRRASQCYLA